MFNPGQPRGRDGKWTAGGAAFRRTVNRGQDIPSRHWLTRAERVEATRYRIKAVDRERELALAGKRVRHNSPVFYASPKKIAEARRLRGHIVRPRGEALAMARERTPTRAAQRAVAFNPLSGRFTDSSLRRTGKVTGVEGSRQVTKASAARAKLAAAQKSAKQPARPKLAKPAYVGRRRAEP